MTEDQLDTAAENLPKEIRLKGPAAVAVISLAAYGAQDLTRKGIAKAQEIRTNRKANKAKSKQDEKSDDTPAEGK